MFEKVQKVIAEQLEIDPETITLDTNIYDDLGADSLDAVELVMSLEDEYGITIPDEAANDLVTVGKIVEYLERVIG
ncbi:MAG: acyl carrier protein [Oscillospiraceae bacterium]|jgi:acyl carrier protein|nr:acyl carrier protein [Oscillospiraceae bacterium]